ncbi:MAG TPA: helix-turn-helix domain-containing protein [Stellaceae bacterium]
MPGQVPREVKPYIDAIGADATLRVLLHLGGAPLYFSDTPTERSRLVRVIGIDKAKALGKALGRGHQRVPSARRWIAIQLHDRGEPVLEIARRLHCNDTTVRRYVSRERHHRQPDLFDALDR